MAVVTTKRIKHLARYSGVFGTICLVGYGLFGHFFLVFLGPPIFIAYWLRLHASIPVGWIPNTPFCNNLFLLFPITLLYFGLMGFQLKNILNERGRIRFLMLVAFLGFLLYVHRLAFQELSLYWEGSKRL